MPRPNRSAVALRHVAFEDLGLLAGVLDARGWSIAYCEAATDDLSHQSIADADLLVVLGGPIGVGDAAAYPFLTEEMRLIERRIRRGLPTLGVCLGAQLMAATLGARVYRGPVKEIGWGALKLTEHGERSALAPLGAEDARVLHWHGDTFDLPKRSRRLASNAAYDNQAFSYGEKSLGLQFHIEASHVGLEEWYVGHAAELAEAGVLVAALRAESRRLAGATSAAARTVFSSWLADVAPETVRSEHARPALAAG